MKKHRGLMMVLGILLILIGIWALVMPVASSMAITVVLGWMLIFGGIMQVIFAIQTRKEVGPGGLHGGGSGRIRAAPLLRAL